jgi:hypothetical protein
MDRKQIIEELTRQELEWLVQNVTEHNMVDMTEFFARGGFNSWTDDQIKNKFLLTTEA